MEATMDATLRLHALEFRVKGRFFGAAAMGCGV